MPMLQMYIVPENFNKKKHCGKITSLIVNLFKVDVSLYFNPTDYLVPVFIFL